eukprot:GFYU01013639.1.p1 GENE.GFYU01013639.1~~GFYU01013639.1.p1  ORF type:complete len:436 (-),score=43.72 GFYU01013639.1:121-1428(-)
MKVITFNCWGVPIAKYRQRRVECIGRWIHAGADGADVVSLQELWRDRDAAYLAEEAGKVFPYSHFYRSGAFGSGLLLLSKYPIVYAFFHLYRHPGKPWKPHHADFYAGKGVAHSILQTTSGPVHVYLSHTHAAYEPKEINKTEEYSAVRVSQMFEMAQYVNLTARGQFALIAGDLNCPPTSIEYQLLRGITGLGDAFADVAHDSDQEEHTLSNRNPYNARPEGQYRIFNLDSNLPETIDYILYGRVGESDPSTLNNRSTHRTVAQPHLKTSSICCTELSVTIADTPNTLWPMSDHYGVAAVFEWGTDARSSRIQTSNRGQLIVDPHTALTQSIAIISRALDDSLWLFKVLGVVRNILIGTIIALFACVWGGGLPNRFISLFGVVFLAGLLCASLTLVWPVMYTTVVSSHCRAFTEILSEMRLYQRFGALNRSSVK